MLQGSDKLKDWKRTENIDSVYYNNKYSKDVSVFTKDSYFLVINKDKLNMSIGLYEKGTNGKQLCKFKECEGEEDLENKLTDILSII